MKRAMRIIELGLNVSMVMALIALLAYALGVQPLMGEPNRDNIWICICLACGGMLMMAVYNAALRLFTRRERAGQFFSLYCVGQSVRFFFMDGSIGASLFPGLPEPFVLFGLRYIPFCLAVVALVLFVYEIYGEGRSRKVMGALVLSLAAVNLIVPALGLDRTVWRGILGGPVGLFFLANSMYVIVRSREFKRNRLSILYLVGFVLYGISFSFTAALYASVPYIAVVFNFAFAVIHSVLLAQRFAHSLQAVERANQALEDKVAERTFDLTLANERLATSERSVRELVQSISHDLKTPMSVLSVNLELLLESDMPPETQRRLNIAYQKSRDLARLTASLFEAVRMESGASGARLEWVRLSHLLDEVGARYADILESAGLALHASYHRDCQVRLDEGQIWRVLDNLITNAQRYTPEGGSIAISVAGPEAGFVTFSVTDTGSGIAKEHIPHLFDQYYKADPSRGGQGAGLGLYIVKTAVLAMGGSVAAMSKPGRGTTISFTLQAQADGDSTL